MTRERAIEPTRSNEIFGRVQVKRVWSGKLGCLTSFLGRLKCLKNGCGNMILLYKNKDIQNCNNYRGIKLLSHNMKVWERIVES